VPHSVASNCKMPAATPPSPGRFRSPSFRPRLASRRKRFAPRCAPSSASLVLLPLPSRGPHPAAVLNFPPVSFSGFGSVVSVRERRGSLGYVRLAEGLNRAADGPHAYTQLVGDLAPGKALGAEFADLVAPEYRPRPADGVCRRRVEGFTVA